MNPPPFPRAALNALRMLWLGIAGSSGLLMVVLQMARRPPSPPPVMTMVLALAACAVACLLASVLLPMATFRAQLARGRLISAPMFTTGAVLGLALTEAVALFGFVLGFLNAPMTTYLPFFAAAWLVFLLRFPRRSSPIGFLGPDYKQYEERERG